MPDWRQELAKVPEIDDHQELAQKVRASFKLPQWISEQHGVENYYQAPLALPCIHQKSFLPPLDPKFACWDIRELQLEKMIAYAQALQFWAEKANLPTQGQPHLLAGSVLELREEMKHYISFPNEAVFSSMVPQRNPNHTIRGSHSQECPTNADQLPCWRGCCKDYQRTN